MTGRLDLIDRFLDMGSDLHAQRADGKTPVILSLAGPRQIGH